MSDLCEQTHGVPYYILGVFQFIAGVFVTCQFYRFIKARHKEQSKNQTIYNLSCAFFALIALVFFLSGLGYETCCDGVRVFVMIAQLGYLMEYLLLFALLFYRLDVVFRGTELPFSKCTKTAFYGSYAMTIVMALLVIAMSVQRSIHSIGALIMLIVFFISVLTFIVMLIGPLIYKLRAVSKLGDNQNKTLMPVVIKTFILSSASIISVIVAAITIVLNASRGRTPASLVLECLIVITDQITNFSSIFLGFNSFEKSTRWCVDCVIESVLNAGTRRYHLVQKRRVILNNRRYRGSEVCRNLLNYQPLIPMKL
eukprot:851481_1